MWAAVRPKIICFATTIYRYQKGKFVMDEPGVLAAALAGTVCGQFARDHPSTAGTRPRSA